MRCRTIVALATLPLSILMTLRAAEVQPAQKVYRIGVLRPGTAAGAAEGREVFRQALRDLGWVEGQHIALEERYAEGTLDRLPALAAELVRLPVDLLLAGELASTRAAKHATTTIPIVFLGVPDPVRLGLVASLAQPGGNLTGITINAGPEFMLERLELLKDTVPTVSRVAILWGQVRSPTQEADEQARERAAQGVGLTLRHFSVQRLEEWTEWVFPALLAEVPAIEALYATGPLAIQARRQLADLALQHRLPLMGFVREQVEAGGLLSYGSSATASWRRAATYVDKSLKGAQPADLPVEQPPTFDLVINLKTAKALGITIPPTVLFQADEVIH